MDISRTRSVRLRLQLLQQCRVPLILQRGVIRLIWRESSAGAGTLLLEMESGVAAPHLARRRTAGIVGASADGA